MSTQPDPAVRKLVDQWREWDQNKESLAEINGLVTNNEWEKLTKELGERDAVPGALRRSLRRPAHPARAIAYDDVRGDHESHDLEEVRGASLPPECEKAQAGQKAGANKGMSKRDQRTIGEVSEQKNNWIIMWLTGTY